MTSIGETLRSARLRRSLELQEIARELKISARFLEAIERDDFDKLPAPVFAKSFARQYARYLGLHEDEIASEVQRMLEPAPVFVESAAPERLPAPAGQADRMAEWESVGERRRWSSSLPSLALVVLAVLGCSGVYAWWERSRRAVPVHEETSSPVQTPQAASAGAAEVHPSPPPVAAPPPASPVTTPPQTAAAAVPQTAAAASENAADRAAAPRVPPKQTETQSGDPAPVPTAQTVAQPPPPGPPGPVHVEVQASDVVWVLARADGKTAFVGTLEASQQHTIDAQTSVVLRLGSAGSAEITLNGKPIGPVGPKGQPRTVEFTSRGFRIVALPKPPDLLDPLL